MKFELIAVEPSGNGSDLILRVRRHPTWWESTLGRTTDQVSYFGPRPFWVTMDGREVNRGEQRALDRLWHQHQRNAQALGVRAWEKIEPPVANRHRRVAARAVAAH